MKIRVNDEIHDVEVHPDTPLLWVLRDELGMKGTKFGCGAALCGSCTVLIDGVASRSCSIPLLAVGHRQVETIEGLSPAGGLHVVQEAWIDAGVPQCGYCQSGMIMAAVHLLRVNPNPTDADIGLAITNLCRCGTYERVRRAIHLAAARLQDGS